MSSPDFFPYRSDVLSTKKIYNHWRLLQVMDFVSRYLPAYHAYLPTLYKEGPNGSKPEHLLVIDIDEARNPIWGS